MIRFIDLRGMETYKEFAFWDTITDSFISFEGIQAWCCKDDFRKDFLYNRFGPLDRFLQLMPDWVSQTEKHNCQKLDSVKNWG